MEQIPDAASSLLNYADTKRRAVASRTYRVKVSSSNGQTFSMGQTINVDLAGNMNNSYYDFGQSYLKLRVENKTPAASVNDDRLYFDGNSGAYCLFDRVQCITGY